MSHNIRTAVSGSDAEKGSVNASAFEQGVNHRFVPAMRLALRQAQMTQTVAARQRQEAIAMGAIARPGIAVSAGGYVSGLGSGSTTQDLHELHQHGRNLVQPINEMSAMTALADVPVGAVVLDRHDRVIARGYNRRDANGDILAHAEIEAMRSAAARTYNWNLQDCTLVVTLEPCPMCAGAAVMSHIGRIVFGAWDAKMGACGSVWDIPRDPHVGSKPEVIGGVLEHECSELLTSFFRDRRK